MSIKGTDKQNVFSEIDPDPSKIEAWYFVPYRQAPDYTPDNPLYSLVAVFDEFGVVMVYDRPGDAGAFHSIDPDKSDGEQRPPSDTFKTALGILVSNPGDEKDITHLVDEMYPWEHHLLEVLMVGLNESPQLLPPEITEFINAMLEDQLTYNIDGDADSTHFGKLVSEEGEHFLNKMM